MAELAERTILPAWSPDEVEKMTDRQLLEAVWTLEADFAERDRELDHRRHLNRSELEQVLVLLQQRAALLQHREPGRRQPR
jgi:hypothetical protein